MGVLSIFIILICVLLTLVVLIQNSKGGGIASNFASNTQVVGVKKQAEYIEKVTWGLILLLMLLCISAGVGNKGAVDKKEQDSTVKAGTAKTAPAPNTVPGVNMPTTPSGTSTETGKP